MTCVVGLVHSGKVFIGGDSAGVDEAFGMQVRADRKVFKNGDMVFGFAGSFRMGNLLQHALEVPPHHPEDDPHKYMVTDFINAVRDCLKKGGVAARSDEVIEEVNGAFLVGYRGRLFLIDSDYQVGETIHGYAAHGCGADIALGSIGSTKGEPRARIKKALDMAERHSAGVRAPFHIEVV
jgi:ATP-dependent protease HslVU (ClpYQ) peptidase subunit